MKSNIDDMIKDIELLQTRTKFLTEEQAQKQSLIDVSLPDNRIFYNCC